MKSKFVYAGLDFIFDKNLNPYFIEANSCPALLLRWNKIYGNFKPLERLAYFFKKAGCSTIALLTKSPRVKKYKNRLFYNIAKRTFEENSLRLHICTIEENKKSIQRNSNKLIDLSKKPVSCDGIFFKVYLPSYRPENVILVNPPEVVKITRDKWLTYLAFKDNSKIRVPISFLVQNSKELGDILRKKGNFFRNGVVLKPRIGEGGRGVYIFKNISQAKKVHILEDYIVQEFIDIKKINDKFWDIRTFAVDGKFIGSIKRVSRNPVVNVSLGGEAKRVEKELNKRISSLSELCVRTIENFKVNC